MVRVERKDFKFGPGVQTRPDCLVAHLSMTQISRGDLKVGLQVGPTFVVVRHSWTNEKRLQNLVIEQFYVDQFRDVTLYKYSPIIWHI